MLYPDVTLPHHWHLDSQQIPVPAVPRSQRPHDEEVRRKWKQLTPAQWRKPEYTVDSPNWEAWFALEHEEQWRLGAHINHDLPSPPLWVQPEEEEAEAEYQDALEEARGGGLRPGAPVCAATAAGAAPRRAQGRAGAGA